MSRTKYALKWVLVSTKTGKRVRRGSRVKSRVSGNTGIITDILYPRRESGTGGRVMVKRDKRDGYENSWACEVIDAEFIRRDKYNEQV